MRIFTISVYRGQSVGQTGSFRFFYAAESIETAVRHGIRIARIFRIKAQSGSGFMPDAVHVRAGAFSVRFNLDAVPALLARSIEG